jgi:hypothetical protein
VAIADWQGGCIAREAKATLPSACVWLNGNVGHGQSYYEKAMRSAVRSRDPYQTIVGNWLIRRLSPDSNPIEIEDLPKERDENILLHAMGSEAANVHSGSRAQAKKLLKDLHRRKSNWLRKAAKEMAKTMEREWKEYRKSWAKIGFEEDRFERRLERDFVLERFDWEWDFRRKGTIVEELLSVCWLAFGLLDRFRNLIVNPFYF